MALCPYIAFIRLREVWNYTENRRILPSCRFTPQSLRRLVEPAQQFPHPAQT
jgi:hypothetical protein